MPELPDVEVFKRYLDATSLHQKIEAVDTDKVSDMPDSFLLPRRKKGSRCPRCEEAIQSKKCAGRTSYFCPKCQHA